MLANELVLHRNVITEAVTPLTLVKMDVTNTDCRLGGTEKVKLPS